MIYGRFQQQVEPDVTWDYIAVPYPEGSIGEEYRYLFNHDQIEKVVARGFDGEEKKNLYKQLLVGRAGSQG